MLKSIRRPFSLLSLFLSPLSSSLGVTWEVVLPIGEQYGFVNAPGPALFSNKSVLAWHCSVLPDWTPDPKYFGWKQSEMKRIGVGGWITETGSATTDLEDMTQLSWMHWDYKWFSNLTWVRKYVFNFFLYVSDLYEYNRIILDCLETMVIILAHSVIQWNLV